MEKPMQARMATWKRLSPLKIGARAPMAPTKRRGIHRELKRLPKGTPSCAVPATARAMTHRNSAEMTASATRLKALKIWSISSEACEPPRPAPQVSHPCPRKVSRICLLASVGRRISEVAGSSEAMASPLFFIEDVVDFVSN